MAHESSNHHFGLAVNLSSEALKSLLWLNGGAATALIALTDKQLGSVDYSCAVLLFGLGAFLTVVAMACGYFSQLAYANHRLAVEDADATKAKNKHAWHEGWQKAAIVLVLLGLATSAAGMVNAFLAI